MAQVSSIWWKNWRSKISFDCPFKEAMPPNTVVFVAYRVCHFILFVTYSVAESEPPGAATSRVEPEPIFLLAEAESQSRLF